MFFIFLVVFIGACALLKVNVAFGVGLGSVVVLILGHYPSTFFVRAAYSSMDSFPFLAVPTFILAGVLMEHSGISGKLIDWCQAICGRIRGSIGAVTKKSLPFLLMGYIVIVIICAFPACYLWLPKLIA